MSRERPITIPITVELDTPEPVKPGIPGVKEVLLVASGKGGVGKSTLAVNLACALAQRGMRIGLADADIYGPSVARMLGTDSLDSDLLQPIERHGIRSLSVGNVLPPESAVAWKGPLVAQTLQQLLFEVEWGELDCLLIDLPPGTGDVQLTLLESLPVSGAVVITTPQGLAVADARRAVALFHQLDIPVFGVVENMARFICPCCGESQALFPSGEGRLLAQQRSVRHLGDIPLAVEAQRCADRGVPLVIAAPESEAAQRMQQIAVEVAESLAREARYRERAFDPEMVKGQRQLWEELLE